MGDGKLWGKNSLAIWMWFKSFGMVYVYGI